jgi:hypothetical protein
MDTMVHAVNDYRGTFDISDYRWFNLRDGDSSAPQPFQHFGLLRSDYTAKPAFQRYRRLVAELTTHQAAPGARPRLSLRLRSRVVAHRCRRTPVRASIAGADRAHAVRAEFFRGRRLVARDRRRPLSRVIDRTRRLRRERVRVARARVRLDDGRLIRLRRRYRLCAG